MTNITHWTLTCSLPWWLILLILHELMKHLKTSLTLLSFQNLIRKLEKRKTGFTYWQHIHHREQMLLYMYWNKENREKMNYLQKTSCLLKHFLVLRGCLCDPHHKMTRTSLKLHLREVNRQAVRQFTTSKIYIYKKTNIFLLKCLFVTLQTCPLYVRCLWVMVYTKCQF